MAKKYEFQPDKPHSTWLNKLQLTKQQQKQALKWCLYALLLIVLSVLQDVVLCRMRLFGGTTDLVPYGIIVICILEGSQKGSIFALLASYLYALSGTAPGPQVIVLITAIAILAAIFRQTYLHLTFSPILLCSCLAVFFYELSVFAFCLFLGSTTPDRFLSFAVPVMLSVVIIPLIYPLAKAIAAIGGETWKE